MVVDIVMVFFVFLFCICFFFLRIRRPPRSTQSRSSAASDVYKRQNEENLINLLSVPIFHARETLLFNVLGKAIVEYNKEIQDCPTEDLYRVIGIAYPRFIQAIHPVTQAYLCLLYTSPSPRDRTRSRMPSSA